jgi:DNA-binding SARP family transcriptional activator
MARGRGAAAQGDREHAAAAFSRALEIHRGELLPDEGAVEWATTARDRYRSDAVGAAVARAEIDLEAGRPEDAAAACRRGLSLDRYRDALWRLRIQASELAGDVAESARLRQSYGEMLAELGIELPAGH